MRLRMELATHKAEAEGAFGVASVCVADESKSFGKDEGDTASKSVLVDLGSQLSWQLEKRRVERIALRALQVSQGGYTWLESDLHLLDLRGTDYDILFSYLALHDRHAVQGFGAESVRVGSEFWIGIKRGEGFYESSANHYPSLVTCSSAPSSLSPLPGRYSTQLAYHCRPPVEPSRDVEPYVLCCPVINIPMWIRKLPQDPTCRSRTVSYEQEPTSRRKLARNVHSKWRSQSFRWSSVL
jgi:hypothetical protein